MAVVKRMCRLSVMGVIILITACTPVTDARQILGIDPPGISHVDLTPPPTIAQYVGQLGLPATQQITFTNTQSGSQQTVTNQTMIEDFVRLLAQPNNHEDIDAAIQGTQEPFKITMTYGTPERVIIALYNPDKDHIVLYNEPTRNWKIHVVGTYGVPSNFGAALFHTLDIK
ncbi:MAG: hypothetical protein GFH27_549287n391 [Chloroflexi bacterium AL-W]|nr:hypothetical protein [Chloroflexi bacterium AL-N1]NOK66665.1 hypothetical protein [Chloroflexi bacterium AL-N10]NOK72053.1 hypothetical protein [Chloroflexi bacterium AL-N5]NOK81310.1 hypothetical protein [Chloroflexi bacterium AL-W]NOK89583.1 hypothetical protein [Chloroflexi bacterium AL-N15]